MPSRRKARSVTPWGERIHAALDGRPQSWLANEAGVRRSTLAAVIQRAVPSADKAVQIARVLGTSVEYLMTGSDGRPAEPLPPLPPRPQKRTSPGLFDRTLKRFRP